MRMKIFSGSIALACFDSWACRSQTSPGNLTIPHRNWPTLLLDTSSKSINGSRRWVATGSA